jgi:hypothetical protein
VRALLRYLSITGILVALAWGCFAVPIHGRTLFGHVRSLGDSKVETLLGRIKADLDERILRREAEKREYEHRKVSVAKLEPPPPVAPVAHRARKPEAVENARPAVVRPGAPRRTHIDERIPAHAEKTIDALVTAHQAR